MKGCELCDRVARMYCESDQASLCWECDARVHGANFLVARHSRSLLCRSCQAPTPWRASGARLGPTVSVCERCIGGSCEGLRKGLEEGRGEGGGGVERERVDEVEEEGEGEGNGEDDEEEEEDGDNQVVPWSLSSPPPMASSSSSEESSSRVSSGFSKRMREDANLACQDDLACSSSRPSCLGLTPSSAPPTTAQSSAEDEATSFAGLFRPSKDRKKAAVGDLRSADSSKSAAQPPSDSILDLLVVRGDHRSVDLVSSASHSPPI